MRSGRVLLLNGPPSCGKTSLACALQDTLDEPWFHLSLDDFRRGYPSECWLTDDGSLFERVLVAYLGALRSLALAGNDVIAEAVMTPSRRALYASTFEGVVVILVGVHCPIEVATARENRRTDRLRGPLDLPADAFAAVHAHMTYDLEVDTSTTSASELAEGLAPRLAAVTPNALRHFDDPDT